MIIIPTYNTEDCIELTLASLSEQTINVPIWIIDNASTDRTIEIAKDFPGVNVYRHAYNCGRIGNWNFCLNWAREKSPLFFKLLMAGDTLVPEANELYEEVFRGEPSLGICFSDFFYAQKKRNTKYIKVLDREYGTIYSKDVLKLLSKSNFMGSLSNIAFRKDLPAEILFDYLLGWASDYLFNIRVSKLYDSFYIDEALSTSEISCRKFYMENRNSFTSKIEDFLVQQKALEYLVD